MNSVEVARLVGLSSVALLVFVLARLAFHYLALHRHFSLGVLEDPRIPMAGTVSVLVPARNEALNIHGCLTSLMAQDYRDLEIVVLDDGSDDGTWEIATDASAANPRVRIIRGQPLEKGWTGKNYAMAQLSSVANGAWLLFADADTSHHPHAVSAALNYAVRHDISVLTVVGRSVIGSFWERVFHPLWPTLLLLFLPPKRVNDPTSTLAFGCGQFLLIRSSAYRAIGGHHVVCSDIVEDCALMSFVKARKINFRVIMRSDLYQVRMYRGLAEIWEGWSKNAYPALVKMGGGVFTLVAAVIGLLLCTVIPFAVSWVAALTVLTVSGVIRLMTKSDVRYSWTLPIGGLLCAAILLNSARLSLAGLPVRWKGRHY